MGIYIFVGLVALVIGGVLTSVLGSTLPILIAVGFIVALVVWALSSDYPKFNAAFSLIACGVGAFLLSSGNTVMWFVILGIVGYLKTSRLWEGCAVYDYVTFDEKIYEFFDDGATLFLQVTGTLLCIGFYMLIGAPAVTNPILAILPIGFLLYRAIRVFMAA
jgi:hypothetical protein